MNTIKMVSFVFNPNHYDDIVGIMNKRGYTQAVIAPDPTAISGTYCIYDGFFMDVYLHDYDDIEDLVEDIQVYATCDF